MIKKDVVKKEKKKIFLFSGKGKPTLLCHPSKEGVIFRQKNGVFSTKSIVTAKLFESLGYERIE